MSFAATENHYVEGARRFPRVSRILALPRRLAFRGMNPDLQQAAMARGTAVHAIIELHNRGCLDESSIHPLLRGYYDSFLQWFDVLKPETIHSEKVVISERHRYGGRLDWKCKLSGRYKGAWIIDVKSGAETACDALQTAAYWCAYVEQEKVKAPMLRAALYVHRDGSPATFAPHTNPSDLAVFLSYRNVYEWEEMTYGNLNGND